MRILIVSDAWTPQVNGVVRTLQNVSEQCQALGHDIHIIAPHQFRSLPCPTYPEIRLALKPGRKIVKQIESFCPDAVHIATEGPLGWSARNICLAREIPFTTSYHTRFPEYVSARFPVPASWGYTVVRRFHAPSNGIMVATPSLARELEGKGFTNIRAWTRGVDVTAFHPVVSPALKLKPPVHLYVGRIAVEKNLSAFLDLDLPGSKLLVGDGPQRAELTKRYPDAIFVGAKFGEDLAAYYRSADVFVFPSKTDTFGLVLLEAMASGLPVAAFPVAGPKDVLKGSQAGVLNTNLKIAISEALKIPQDVPRAYAMTYSWKACAQQFIDNIRQSVSEGVADNANTVTIPVAAE